jgi:hypothetical protein
MSKKESNPPANFSKPPAPNGPQINSSICLFCGKTYEEHKDGNTDSVTLRVGLCLLLK